MVSLCAELRDHFVYAPNLWEAMLHCNVVSHCLCAYTKWSLELSKRHTDIFCYLLSFLHTEMAQIVEIPHGRKGPIYPNYPTVNSLAPGGFENIFQNVFFKLISWMDTLSNSCETALRSMPQNPSDDKSTLVQVMAWCRQAASHYLSQCCPRSLSPYGVTRPQWVNTVWCRLLWSISSQILTIIRARYVVCLLWVQTLIYVLFLFL